MGKVQKICLVWVMLFLAAVAFSSRGHAPDKPVPQPFEGTWHYSGELTPVLKIQVERVPAISESGKLRLAKLKNEKYGCHHVMRGIWRCSRQVKLEDISGKARRNLEKQMTTSILSFIPSDGGFGEIHDGESFKSWKVDRPVHTEVGIYESYEWTWTPSISKVILRDELNELPTVYLNLGESLNISQQYSVNHTVDKNRFEIHVIQAHFQKSE